ncbi:MAG: hypothetical protein R6T92_01880 [Desulfosalsimonadaceae bacterium]
MNCSDIRKRINEEILQGKPLLTHDEAVCQHIRHCDLCRSLYSDAVLAHQLREMPVPEPHDDFAARAIRNAVKRNRMKRIRSLVGISAAAMLIVAAGLVFTKGLPDFTGRPVSAPNAGLNATGRMEKTVRVMIETRQSRQNATLAIDLAENVALKNYPGQRQLTWQTELTQGRNLLELPLVFADDAEGYVNIRYRYNGKDQQVRIPVRAGKENEPQTTITS